ncbi:MAG: ABC transporter permease [Armatimonadota bacterium]|nr:ABC transporter permease [Armatimonadota bacterium]MDW8155571.1 ABC transporter permease [Armatimonadota bacterium]
MSRRRPTASRLTALAVLAATLAVAALSGVLAPRDPRAMEGPPLTPPRPGLPFGTDDLGRDLWSLWCHGTRTSLQLGMSVALLSTTAAVLVGVTGSLPNFAARLLDGLARVVVAVPSFFLAVLLVSLLGPSTASLAASLAASSWAAFSRVVHTQVRLELRRDYVWAARALGATEVWVLRRHVLPALVPLAWSKFVLTVRWAVLMEATLGLVGLSDPVRPSWGAVLGSAFAYPLLFTGRVWLWWAGPPAASVLLLTWALVVLGEGLEAELDPRTRNVARRPMAPTPAPRRGAGSRGAPQA